MKEFLEIFASFVLFLNKVYLGRPLLNIDKIFLAHKINDTLKKQLGWSLAILGMAVLTLIVQLYVDKKGIFNMYHFFLAVLSGYGLYIERRLLDKKSIRLRRLRVITSVVAMISCLYVFVFFDHSNINSWFKIIMSIFGLTGTLFMANLDEKTGWTLFAGAHVFAMPAFWSSAPIISVFQFVSLLWAIGQIKLIPKELSSA